MKEIYKLMQDRRSIRKFTPELISDEKLEKIFTAGGFAPSGANQQPWLYVIVDNQQIKKDIRVQSEEVDARWNAERTNAFRNWLKKQEIVENSKPFLEEAPLLLCIFGDSTKPYWLESTWISIAYLLLAIEEEGLGTLTYTPGYPDFLNQLLNVPEKFIPQVILPLGYPAEEPPASIRPRRILDAFVHTNRFQDEGKI